MDRQQARHRTCGAEAMTRKPLKPRPWTAEEVQQLRELATAGASASIIAQKLKRTSKAVRAKAKSEDIALPKGKSE
jgi:hypothetical protein